CDVEPDVDDVLFHIDKRVQACYGDGTLGYYEVGGHELGGGDVVDLVAQRRIHRHLPQEGVEFVDAGGLLEVEVEDRHRHVRGGNADRIARELPGQLRQGLGHGLGGTGLGEHHVQPGRTTATRTLVEVVDEVLVVGERVHRLDMTVADAEAVVDRLEHGSDRVRRARSGREDLVRVIDRVIVDSEDDVL